MISRYCLLFLLSSIICDGCSAKLLTKTDLSDACKEGIDLSFRGFNDSEINELLVKKLLDKYVSDMQPLQLRGGYHDKPNDPNCGKNYNDWCQYGILDDLIRVSKQLMWVLWKIPTFVVGLPISPYSPYPPTYSPQYYDDDGSYSPSYSGGYDPNSYSGYGESLYGNNYYGMRYENSNAGRQVVVGSFGQLQPPSQPQPPMMPHSPHGGRHGRQRFGRRELVATCDRIEFPDVFDLKKLRDVRSFIRSLKLRTEIRIPQTIINGIANALHFAHSSRIPKNPTESSSTVSDLPPTLVDDLSSLLSEDTSSASTDGASPRFTEGTFPGSVDDTSFTPVDGLPNTRDEKFEKFLNSDGPQIEVPVDLLEEQPTETNTEEPSFL